MCRETRILQNNHLSIEDGSVSVKQNFEKMAGKDGRKMTKGRGRGNRNEGRFGIKPPRGNKGLRFAEKHGASKRQSARPFPPAPFPARRGNGGEGDAGAAPPRPALRGFCLRRCSSIRNGRLCAEAPRLPCSLASFVAIGATGAAPHSAHNAIDTLARV